MHTIVTVIALFAGLGIIAFHPLVGGLLLLLAAWAAQQADESAIFGIIGIITVIGIVLGLITGTYVPPDMMDWDR